jgi:general secretion pathway protein D
MPKPKTSLKKWVALTLAASVTGPAVIHAQSSKVSDLAQREIIRRQQAVELAEENLIKGDELMEKGDYEGAVSQYRGAVEMLPDAPISQYVRQTAIEKMNDAAIALTKQRIDEARWQDAKDLVEFVLTYDEKNGDAKSLKDKLEDPEFYNQTKTPTYVAKVEDVTRLLREADQFYASGEFAFALKRVDQVLNIDPFNGAARRIQEKIYATISKGSGRDGYNAHRAKLLNDVTGAWAPVVQDYGQTSSVIDTTNTSGVDPIAKNTNKLNSIILPAVQFESATIAECLEYLRQQSVRLDPAGEGLNFVLRTEEGAAAAPAAAPAAGGELGLSEFGAAPTAAATTQDVAQKRISVRLTNVPLAVALKYITDLAGLKYRVEEFAVTILPAGATTEADTRLYTREFRVPPDFLSRDSGTADAGGGGGAGGGSFFTPDTTTSVGGGGRGTKTAKDILQAAGVSFDVPNSSATFLSSSSKLVVRHTQQNIDLIESIVNSMVEDQPKQVQIMTKFVEVNQTNLNELGFDWLLGQSNLPGGDRVFTSGGTTGYTSPLFRAADFPFVAPGSSTPVGTNPVTSGNRSGMNAITPDSIDSLLFPSPGVSTMASGVFSLAGVFTDPQFQVVVRALEQKKAVDLLSAPSVTTKSGQRAVVQINREFRYPVEFDPPQIPQNFGRSTTAGADPVLGIASTPQVFPVTPTTPTAFETKNTGVTLEVEPTVGADGVTIDLNLIPEVIEFEGFINYGSPIQTFSLNALGQNEPLVITPNVINQPVFSVRRVSTNVSVWDGSTVVLGGLMREDIQKVEDKVPFLGDLPFIGRLFKSESEQQSKRNLVIFVTATLIDPAGVPIRFQDRMAETPVEPLGIPEAAIQQIPEIPLFK